jgi:hypothetical protein
MADLMILAAGLLGTAIAAKKLADMVAKKQPMPVKIKKREQPRR